MHRLKVGRVDIGRNKSELVKSIHSRHCDLFFEKKDKMGCSL